MAFLIGVGVAMVALLTYAEVGTKTIKSFRTQRTARYAADGAIEQGIAWAKDQPTVGIDDASAAPCVMNVPGVNNGPNMVVSCAPTAGSGSGLPTEQGSTPEFALLTLGERDKESPSLNGPTCLLDGPKKGWDSIGANKSAKIEYGIRFAPTRGFGCFSATRQVGAATVKGKVFSNSPIITNGGGSIKLASTTPASTLQARGGCQPAIAGCTDPGRNDNDPLIPSGNNDDGQDPRTDNTATAAERAQWNLPDLTSLTKRAVPSTSACGNGKTVIFEPGWYDDIEGLNDLFKSNACKGTTFWFSPGRGSDGQIMGPGYKSGLYYFDFAEGNGGGCNYYSASASTAHQWCVGNASDSNQNVIGGTPLGWSPYSTGSSSTATLPMTDSQVDTFGTTFWSPSGYATKIDTNSAKYTNQILAIDRPITLKNFTPKVPARNFPTSSFNIKVAHRESNSFNAPKITVSYDTSLFGSRTCGTYTLSKGEHNTDATASQLSGADQAALGRCLNNGDKINGVKVKYTISGCTLFCGSQPELNGITLLPGGYPDQPTFPDESSCDPKKPGVQFIFGGDSHLYVADGNFEICAGPAAQNTLTAQQIAFYNVPALQPMRPRIVAPAATVAERTGTANLANATRIAEPTSSDRGKLATISYQTGNCGFCVDKIIRGGLDLTYSKINIPANTSVSRVIARASYDTNGLFTGPQLTLNCSSGTATKTFSPSDSITYSGVRQEEWDVTSCLRNKVTAGDVTGTWWARTSVTCFFGICGTLNPTDGLDGVEFLVEVESDRAGDSSNPVPVPAKGCVTDAPNYWNAEQGGDASCAIIKADQTKTSDPFNPNSPSAGRFSAKGTIYVPSAAVDIDDESVSYPFFGRGLVARTLMFRGFRYKTEVPMADVPPVDKTQKPREMTFTACSRPGAVQANPLPCGQVTGDRIYARARVRFEADKTAGIDVSKAAKVPKILWYSADR